MIVRINQIDPARVEADGGWPAGPHTGPFRGPWPVDLRALELLILSEDERKQPLTDAFRQQQLRQLIPQAAIALSSPDGGPAGPAVAADSPVAIRLDGRVADGELLPAWRHLTDADGRGRFGFSASAKFDDLTGPPWGSVRVVPSWRLLARICGDPALGLERSVRLRLVTLPAAHLPAMLETATADDPRWAELMAQCPLYVGTTAGLKSLHILVRQLDAAQVKARVMQRLMAVARGEPAVPA